MDCSFKFSRGREALRQALKRIRHQRMLTVTDVADRMGMKYRTYEEFEGGRGAVTTDLIFRFSDATNSDPFALILTSIFDSADIAVDCANTKLVTIMMMTFRQFLSNVGSDVVYLNPVLSISAFESLFADLQNKLQRDEQIIDKWLSGRVEEIGNEELLARLLRRRQSRTDNRDDI